MVLVVKESQDHPHDLCCRAVDLLVLVGHEGGEGGEEPLLIDGSGSGWVVGRETVGHDHPQQLYARPVGLGIRTRVAEVVEHNSGRDKPTIKREREREGEKLFMYQHKL